MKQRRCSLIPLNALPRVRSTKTIKRSLVALLYPTILLFCLGSTYVVPDDELTIQAAIDSSASGDTILVRAGTYVENLHTLGKTLTLQSLDGPEATILDGNQQGSVIEVTGDAHIEGFTIRNGWNEDGGGIRAIGPDKFITVAIVGNIITENRAGSFDVGLGGGIVLLYPVVSVIEGNLIEGNYAGDSGGGVAVERDTKISNNVIVNNGCHVGGGGIRTYGDTEITGNLILENWADNHGGGIGGTASVIRGNTIVRNYVHNSAAITGVGIRIFEGTTTIEQNIVALNHGPPGANTGVGISCRSGTGIITVRCNDVWGNDWDYLVGAGCDTTGLGNFSEDPKFCDLAGGNFELDAPSPCASENSGGCGLVGAFPVGCMVPTLKTTWGKLKSHYSRGN